VNIRSNCAWLTLEEMRPPTKVILSGKHLVAALNKASIFHSRNRDRISLVGIMHESFLPKILYRDLATR
ncbi:MAG: hypothetical protein ACKOW8_07905, partial [Flavobacteriales bacterium]